MPSWVGSERDSRLLTDTGVPSGTRGVVTGGWSGWTAGCPDPDGGLVVAVGRDVTELRHAQVELAALALRDPMTGLANRRLLDELFELAVARGPRSGARGRGCCSSTSTA
jgi:hypothetical protein